uniref:Uncharacterized protein n=1 Tax=Oryza punctata TaxID=4537 RepID=A0A0E0JVY0_ORYPU
MWWLWLGSGGPKLKRLLAAHCSTERTMRARLDGLKKRLRAKDDELGRKGLEMEGLARSLREARAENKRLQAELDKGKYEVKKNITRNFMDQTAKRTSSFSLEPSTEAPPPAE